MTRLRLLAICLALCAPSALAGRLEIPLRVPLEPLRQALAAQLAAFWHAPKSSTPSAAEPGPTSRKRPSTASRLSLSRLR